MSQVTVNFRRSYIKFLLGYTSIKDSADFTLFAKMVYTKTFGELSSILDPVWNIESGNKSSGWIENVVNSEREINKLSRDEVALYSVYRGYSELMHFLLNDQDVGEVFSMEETDTMGWRIYKELDKKYLFTKEALVRLRAHKKMKHEPLELPEGVM